MAFPSPTRSSPTLNHYLRHRSGSKSSHSQTSYARSATKPKRFQSAHYDGMTGTWRCKHCGYTYPNPEPHHHQRRAHKKLCPGASDTVLRWLSVLTGKEAEGDGRDSSNAAYKSSAPDSSDSVKTEQDQNSGFEGPHLSDRKFEFHETRSSNELSRESEIQDPKGILSDEPGQLAAGENSEAQRKEERDSEPVTEDFKPRTSDLDRLLTLNSDISLPSGISLDTSDLVDFSGVASSDCVPATDVSASGNQEGMDIGRKEPLSVSSQDGAHSPEVDEDVLTADDALERTEIALGVPSTPSSSDGTRLTDSAPEDVGESFQQGEPDLNVVDNDPQEKTADVLQQVEDSPTTTTEDRNTEELKVTMSEGFGDTKLILPAAADDVAPREKEEEKGSEQGIVTIGGDGAEYERGDEHESSQLVRGTGDEEASQHGSAMDQSGHVVHATEEVDGLDGHDETAEVDARSLEPLSADAEGVAETPPNTKLSFAERMWDNWKHLVSGDDASGQERSPPLPREIDEDGQAVSEDGLTLSLSHNREGDNADTDAQMLEPRGTSALTSDQEGGHEIGFQPALDWTSASSDTVNKGDDKQKSVVSRESSTSADIHLSPDQGRQELIPGSGPETDQPNKVALRLSAAEANWDDWEDVINRGPMLMEGITTSKDQDPKCPGEYQTSRLDCHGDVSELGQGKPGTALESESFVEGGIDAAAATDLPVHISDSENADWLIDFSEPSVEEKNPGTANEAAIAIGTSSPKPEVPGSIFLDLLDLTEGSGQEQGAVVLDRIPVIPGQSSKEVLSRLSLATRNWKNWDDVVRGESNPIIEI